jgi:hypothetical protein
VRWDGATPPNRLTVRFARFSIDTSLSANRKSLAADTTAGAARP